MNIALDNNVKAVDFNGQDIAEVIFNGITVYYKQREIVGTSPMQFKALGLPLKDYLIGGNMVQNGTPTPTSPIYPQECGDRTPNLWNPSLPETERIFEIEPNTKYTAVKLSPLGPNVGYLELTIYDADMNQLWTDYAQIWGAVTCIGLSDAKYAKVRILANNVQNPEKYVGFMKTDDYDINTPYGYQIPITCGGETKNIYLTEPLRKIGDYADEVNSDGTVTIRIKKLVLTGEEAIQIKSGNAKWHIPISDMKTPTSARVIEWCCSHYQAVINDTSWASYNYMISWAQLDTGASIGLRIRDIDFLGATVTGFKSYLAAQYAAGTPVTVWYVIAAPTTEQVTAPTLTPATGNNTLAIGTTLQPSSLSITGHVKPSS